MSFKLTAFKCSYPSYSILCMISVGLPVGFLLLQYSVLFTVKSLCLLYLLVIS